MQCKQRKLNRTVNQLELLANQFPIYFTHQFNKAVEHAQALNSSGTNKAEQEEYQAELEWVNGDKETVTRAGETTGPSEGTRVINNDQYKYNQKAASPRGKEAKAAKATKARKHTKKGDL